jgi:hypothetical protein
MHSFVPPFILQLLILFESLSQAPIKIWEFCFVCCLRKHWHMLNYYKDHDVPSNHEISLSQITYDNDGKLLAVIPFWFGVGEASPPAE